jgi:nucleotidyltransferase/DNA polymerase involved in DNA repair
MLKQKSRNKKPSREIKEKIEPYVTGYFHHMYSEAEKISNEITSITYDPIDFWDDRLIDEKDAKLLALNQQFLDCIDSANECTKSIEKIWPAGSHITNKMYSHTKLGGQVIRNILTYLPYLSSKYTEKERKRKIKPYIKENRRLEEPVQKLHQELIIIWKEIYDGNH